MLQKTCSLLSFEIFRKILSRNNNNYCRVNGTHMGSGLEALSARNNKKHSKRTKKHIVPTLTTVSFKGELSLFFKNVKYRISILGILVAKT